MLCMAAEATSEAFCIPSSEAWSGEKPDLVVSTPATSISGRRADTPAATTRVSSPPHSEHFESDLRFICKGHRIFTSLNLFSDLDEVLRIREVCSNSEYGIIRSRRRQAPAQQYDFIHLILPSSDDADASAALCILFSYSAPNSTGSTEDEDTLFIMGDFAKSCRSPECLVQYIECRKSEKQGVRPQ